ncbi:MAG: GSCFA domain-containing protein [Flavobacterium sp.]|nr:MAG: GSCFA domain-containing protein [Flavobacterium sp.]
MKLQTTIPLTPAEDQIDYNSKVLLLGSCFTEHIGDKLEYYKFDNCLNPFGIIFHPKAMERLVERAVLNQPFNENDIFELNGRWHCLEVHSLVSGAEKSTYLNLLNERLTNLGEYLTAATHIILTFGSAWGYRYKPYGAIVANCHKIPQNQFTKEISSVEEVVKIVDRITELITIQNKKVQLIFTVSPVRHLKDGFVENMRSKAHLLAGIHRSSESHPANRYFPSYEVMMDELRDYRFYTEDMLHPNKTAVEIIWNSFSEVWIDPSTASLQKEIASIRSAMAHKPFNPESPSHYEFQEKLQEKIRELQQKLPHLKF